MTGLEEGTNYEFRVRPANAAGVGMASMPSDPTTAKAVEGNVHLQSTELVCGASESLLLKTDIMLCLCCQVKPVCSHIVLIQGAQEVSCVVDGKSGDIVLTFESCQMNEGSHFMWKKDYKDITDFSKGIEIKTEGNV